MTYEMQSAPGALVQDKFIMSLIEKHNKDFMVIE